MRCVNSSGMKKLQTMLYHCPDERVGGEVSSNHYVQMIGKLGEDKKANWPGHLAEIVCMPTMPTNLL